MNCFKLIFVFFLCLAFVQCEQKPSPQTDVAKTTMYALTIEWTDGASLHSVLYKMDGRIVGRGKEAYKLVLERIEALPENSRILIKMPGDIAYIIQERTGGEDPFPVEGYEAERGRFMELCLKKKISIVTEKFKQKEFVK